MIFRRATSRLAARMHASSRTKKFIFAIWVSSRGQAGKGRHSIIGGHGCTTHQDLRAMNFSLKEALPQRLEGDKTMVATKDEKN